MEGMRKVSSFVNMTEVPALGRDKSVDFGQEGYQASGMSEDPGEGT